MNVALLLALSVDAEALVEKRCLMCHGPAMQSNGFRVDKPGAAISQVLDRVASTKPGYAMPPAGPRLTEEEVAALKVWVDRNSRRSHWAYEPVKRTPGATIDSFVAKRSPEAPRETLARRASLDLRGIPPSPAEVREFLDDTQPGAYERLVDRYLASPHFGERWARHWLDLARYADSDGYEKDQVRPYAFRWRNWVIDAFNRDLPFDRFTVEQIAGDLLPNADTETRVATGFHRNTLVNREAGVSRAEDRFEQTINRTNTISTTWLGLTAGCAQCHDHKYDAISQREYYQLFAFMNSVVEEDIDAPLPGELGPWLAARDDFRRKRQALLDEYKIGELQPVWERNMRAAIDKPGANVEWDFALTSFTAMLDHGRTLLVSSPGDERLTNYFIFNLGPDFNRDKDLVAKIKELREKWNALNAATPQLTRAYAISESKTPAPTHIALRGDYKRPGATVEPDVLRVLPPLPSGEHPRLAFAKWIVSRDNPLTARVIVNRFWQEFFGSGLVRTSEDFGTQGEKPTYPELLDHLAAEFMDNGWSVKKIMRTIVTSATYKQSSKLTPELRERDPANSTLARQSRIRLSAEAIRDSALAVSGLLDTRVGGPSVRPPQPPGVAELGYANSVKWRESTGADRYRRGLYIHFQRTAPYPQLMNFDAPESVVACSRRRTSNTPLQSLNLLNDPVFFEAASALVERHKGAQNAVKSAFFAVLGRNPTPKEGEILAKLAESEGLLAVARVLLNLDEFITRE